MAEMMVSKGEAAACEPSSRSARRRRMELRQFKFIVDLSKPEASNLKRKKLEIFAASFSVNDDNNNTAVGDCVSDDDGETVFMVKNGRSGSKTNGVILRSYSSPSFIMNMITPKTNPELRLKFGYTSLCGRRRDMEDAVAVHPAFHRRGFADAGRFGYFGVYDGHGCSHVATRCREQLHQLVKEELILDKECEWRTAMERSFTRMDKEVTEWSQNVVGANCRCELQSPECDAVGSTAVVAIVTPEKIIVANCGDSRAVLCRKGKAVPLSSDHKPDRPDELIRIEAAGGRVIYWDSPRVLGVLAMSRAIGDNYLKPYVSCEPEVTITDRTPDDDCLILASDGLWDVVSNDTACGVTRMCLKGKGMRKQAPSSSATVEAAAKCGGKKEEISDRACTDASMLLTKLALARHSTDNVSVVVVDLRKATCKKE